MTISACLWIAAVQNGGPLHRLHFLLSSLASFLLLLALIVLLVDPERRLLMTALSNWRNEWRTLGISTAVRSMIPGGMSIFSTRNSSMNSLSTPKEIEAGSVVGSLNRHTPPKGSARIWAVVSVLIIVASWWGWAWLAVHDSRRISVLESELAKYRTQTVVEHNVVIVRRLDDGDFAFISDEEPKGGSFRPCAADAANGLDVDGLLTQAIGYMAASAAWEERGTCKSILRSDLGFWFRD